MCVGAILGMFSALFLAIAFAFIPVGAVYNVVFEKSKNQKHQQLVSGVSIFSYWIGNYIADFLIALPTVLFVFAMVHIFDVSSFLKKYVCVCVHVSVFDYVCVQRTGSVFAVHIFVCAVCVAFYVFVVQTVHKCGQGREHRGFGLHIFGNHFNHCELRAG